VTVEQLVPCPASLELDEILARLRQPSALAPFDDAILNFASSLSTILLRDPQARGYGELVALAYWMRKAELTRLRDEYQASGRADVVRVPRGLVFHVPPANVDTIFVYSWLLSVLCGNRNLVRLSRRASPQTEILCRVINQALAAADSALQQGTAMIRYGHEQEITDAASLAADVRVIWGGDHTVNLIRRSPLAPHAKELTFPDRYSMAALKASAYLAAAPEQVSAIAEKFYNDLFWFDQMACSSPRIVFWVGEDAACRDAAGRFYRTLAEHPKARMYEQQPAARIQKFTFACGALMDAQAEALEEFAPLSVLDRVPGSAIPHNYTGAGLIFSQSTGSLTDLTPFIERRHQTMVQFGFGGAELTEFARSLNGRGLDRIVPIGRALDFYSIWDGFDLLEELTRHVQILSVP
jgi:hypothetical protein